MKQREIDLNEERTLLETLDRLVRSEKIRAALEPIVARVRADLARKKDARMAWEPVPLEIFGTLPPSIRSAWVFILRAGADTGAERHPNSHQRMMTFAGTGDMKTDTKGAPNAIESESDIVWQSNLLVDDPGAPLQQRWISIPKNVWHRPVIPNREDWVVISFHTVAAETLVEERPGDKQMVYFH